MPLICTAPPQIRLAGLDSSFKIPGGSLNPYILEGGIMHRPALEKRNGEWRFIERNVALNEMYTR